MVGRIHGLRGHVKGTRLRPSEVVMLFGVQF
jgi:hypothetical protein